MSSTFLHEPDLLPRLLQTDSPDFKLINIGSGIAFPQSLKLELRDLYNQVVLDDSSSTLSFLNKENYTIGISKSFAIATAGVYNFDYLVLTHKINSKAPLSLQISGIPYFPQL